MYDLTTLAGWQAWAREKAAENPDLLIELMPLIDPEIDRVIS